MWNYLANIYNKQQGNRTEIIQDNGSANNFI